MGALAICALLATSPSYAQKATGLTEASVRAFMDESLGVYKKPYPEFLAFTDKMTHGDFNGQMVMTFHKGNDAPIQVPMNMDRDLILSTAREGYDSMKHAVMTQDIHEIKISPDKKSASIKSTLTIKNQKIVGDKDSEMTMTGDSVTQCLDEIVYTPEHGIQALHAQYTADITIKQEQEL